MNTVGMPEKIEILGTLVSKDTLNFSRKGNTYIKYVVEGHNTYWNCLSIGKEATFVKKAKIGQKLVLQGLLKKDYLSSSNWRDQEGILVVNMIYIPSVNEISSIKRNAHKNVF